MKLPQFFITLFLASICVLLSIIVSWRGWDYVSAEGKKREVERADNDDLMNKQGEINRALPEMQTRYQVWDNLRHEIANTAYDPATQKVKNNDLKELLTRNNIQVNFPQPTPSAPTSATPSR